MNTCLNIVVPMAGRGSRFANAGYPEPKPLIPILEKPMIEWVVENIRPSRAHRFIFLCLQEHLDQFPSVTNKLRSLCDDCEIIPVQHVTEGAACTVLLSQKFIDNDQPLMIANSDQIVDISIDDYLATMDANEFDGLIMTFLSDDPKWSYCRLNSEQLAIEVVEKKVVSNEATVGIYNFKRGRDFVRAANTNIVRNLRVNGEFYVAPCYNVLIEEGATVMIRRTGGNGSGMHGLGTPEDLAKFVTKIDKAREA